MRDDEEQPTTSRDEATWRPRHVGFERDGLVLGGLDIWSLTWRLVDAPPVQLPHPTHPDQRHSFRVYQVTDGRRVARFAAAELSNGVWGFYVPGEASDPPPAGVSADAIARAHQTSLDKANAYTGLRLAPDGSLRVALAAVEWSNSHWVMSPRIIEVATGRILLDLWNTDWDAEATFPRERCVRLTLRRYQSRIHLQAVLDLATDSFVTHEDVAGPPTMGPLADLAPALEAASRRAAAAKTQPARAPGALSSEFHRNGNRSSHVGPRQILVALQILVGALAAIAVLSFVAVRMTPAPSQKLTPRPAMPDAPASRRPGP